jgi:crossover junction endodeoxyribonuclease RusA
MIELTIYGTPAPQGSKRHVGNGILIESSRKVTPWREAIVSEVLRQGMEGLRMPGPVVVRLTFFLERPRGHTTPKGVRRASAPAYPLRRPDLDKLVRSSLDGLTQSGIVTDDAVVTTIHAAKRYADARPAGAAVTIHAEEYP